MEEWVTLISTVGFPIAMCVMLFWYIKTEVSQLRDVITQNTAAMKQILEHFRKEDSEGV